MIRKLAAVALMTLCTHTLFARQADPIPIPIGIVQPVPNNHDALLNYIQVIEKDIDRVAAFFDAVDIKTLTQSDMERVVLALGTYLAQKHRFYLSFIRKYAKFQSDDRGVIIVIPNGHHIQNALFAEYFEKLHERLESHAQLVETMTQTLLQTSPLFVKTYRKLLLSHPTTWTHYRDIKPFTKAIRDLRLLPLSVLREVNQDQDARILVDVLRDVYQDLKKDPAFITYDQHGQQMKAFWRLFIRDHLSSSEKEELNASDALTTHAEKHGWTDQLLKKVKEIDQKYTHKLNQLTINHIQVGDWDKRFWNYIRLESKFENPYSRHSDYFTTFVSDADRLGHFVARTLDHILKHSDRDVQNVFLAELLTLGNLINGHLKPCYTTLEVLNVIGKYGMHLNIGSLHLYTYRMAHLKYVWVGEKIAIALNGIYTRGRSTSDEERRSLKALEQPSLKLIDILDRFVSNSYYSEKIEQARKTIQNF